jgi:choline kinase
MNTIILAAGLGHRLGSVTDSLPKAMVDVAGVPLIIHVIRFARQLNGSEIVVVGGYKSSLVREVVRGEGVIYVENPEYRSGNLYSLNCAREHMGKGFIQLNTDHLFPLRVAAMLRDAKGGIQLISDFDRRLFDDDMKIRIRTKDSGPGHITAISKKLNHFDGGYCGITVVSEARLAIYLSAMDTVLDRNIPQAVVEDVINELIDQEHYPEVIDVSHIRWLEIDTWEDLKNAQRILRMVPHFLS